MESSLIRLFRLHCISNQSINPFDSTIKVVPESEHILRLLLFQYQRPSLNYCDSLLAGLSNCTQAPEQTVFKTLTVIILKCELDPVTSLLKTLPRFTLHPLIAHRAPHSLTVFLLFSSASSILFSQYSLAILTFFFEQTSHVLV